MMWLVGVYVVVVILAIVVGCLLMQSYAKIKPSTGRVVRYLATRKVELWSALVALIALCWCIFIHMLKQWLHL